MEAKQSTQIAFLPWGGGFWVKISHPHIMQFIPYLP